MHYFVIFLQSHFTFFHSCCDEAVSLIFSTNKQLSQNIVLGQKCSQVHVLLPYTVNHCSFKCEVVISTTWGHVCFQGNGKGVLSIQHYYIGCLPHTHYCVGIIILILPRKEQMIREKSQYKATSCRLQAFTTHEVPSEGRFLKKKMRHTLDLGNTVPLF